VPHGDPTLLFYERRDEPVQGCVLGLEKREYSRATTAQKCVRAGGKHNDLENVASPSAIIHFRNAWQFFPSAIISRRKRSSMPGN